MDTFRIGDKLPTVYEVAQTIYHYSKAINTDIRSRTITQYVSVVRELWGQELR